MSTGQGSVDLTRRASKVRAALDAEAHHTEHFSHAGGCSLGEAIVELLRLERAGLAVRGRGYAGMTWRAPASNSKPVPLSPLPVATEEEDAR